MASMKLSLSRAELLDYVFQQMNNFFPDRNKCKSKDFVKYLDLSLERTEYCFSAINSKYFHNGRHVLFDHLHGDHYAMFLYFFASTLYREGYDENTCKKLFLLNKCLHGIDAFYEVELPDIFLFVHPLGTVLGRGSYSDYFIVYQRCNVGANKDQYPTLSKYVSMQPGAAILGNCTIGENCRIAAHALILDRDLEDNSVYMGNPNSFVIKKSPGPNRIWK